LNPRFFQKKGQFNFKNTKWLRNSQDGSSIFRLWNCRDGSAILRIWNRQFPCVFLYAYKRPSPLFYTYPTNKSSAVAEMGNRLATIDMGQKWGGREELLWELGPHLTHCGMGQGLPLPSGISIHPLLATIAGMPRSST